MQDGAVETVWPPDAVKLISGAWMFYCGRDKVHAWIDNSVKTIASDDLFRTAIQSRIAAGSAPSPLVRVQLGSVPVEHPCQPDGSRDRSALRRPVYGPYIGRASAARLITLSRMIYSVVGAESGARGVTVVVADVRRPVAVAVTCRHLSRRPPGPKPRRCWPQTDGLTPTMDGTHLPYL